MKMFRIDKFKGVVSAVDAEHIPLNAASDCSNVRLEDGCIRPRHGFKNLSAALGTAAKGLVYLDGYSTSLYTELEEYVSIENVGGTLKPYPINPSTGAKGSAITNGASALSLNNSDWYGFAWRDTGYFYNATDGLAKHTIGTSTSWTPISMPATPTVRAGWSTVANAAVGMDGIDPSAGGEVAVTGLASNTNSSYSSPIAYVRHTTGIGPASVEFILSGTTAGNRDWYWNDAFSFCMMVRNQAALDFDPSSISVTMSNDAGTPVTIKASVLTKRISGSMTQVVAWWDNGKTRTDWGDGAGTAHTAKIKIEYSITKNTSTGTGSANSEVEFIWGGGFSYLGWTRTLPSNVSSLTNQILEFAYSWYDTTTGLESDISPIGEIPYNSLYMPDPDDVSMFDVGVKVNMTFPSTATADKARIYVKDLNGTWRRVTTVNDTASPYVFYTPYVDLIDLTAYDGRRFETTRKVVGGFPFKSWVVWLYKGSETNVRHSRVGDANSQGSPYDAEDDYNRGENYTLGNNCDDEPLTGYQCGDAAIIVGNSGVYAQLGDYPAGMTPCTRVPGSFGCAGKMASARWMDDKGNAVVVYLSKTDGVIYYVYVGPDGSSQCKELAPGIRGLVSSFLGTTLSSVEFAIDEGRDALWVIYGKKALVLRRPNLIDKERPWEPYTFTMDETIYRASFTGKRKNRWIRSDGKFDDVEYDSQGSAWITTDAGTAITFYWTSKVFYGPNRRIDQIEIDRETVTETATITAYSERYTSGNARTVAASTRTARFGALQTGRRHWFKIAPGGSSAFRGITIEEKIAGGRRGS